MCGLFGWAKVKGEMDDRENSRSEPEILAHITQLASRRGPDCCGLWIDGDLWRGYHTKKGYEWQSVTRNITVRDANYHLPFGPRRILLGHFRLATGLPSTQVETQPLVLGNLALTHNGAVENYSALVEEHQPHLRTSIDSELLLWLIHRADGSLEQRLRAALELAHMGAAWALALTDGAELILVNRNLNLYALEKDGSLYWCSVRPGVEWDALAGTKVVGLSPVRPSPTG